MSYSTNINWDLFFNQVDLLHDDNPVYIKNFLPNFLDYLSWEDVENILNQEQYSFSIIDPNTKTTHPIPEKFNLYNESFQDKEHVAHYINQGYTFSSRKYSLYNKLTQLLCSEIEQLLLVNTDINIFGNKREHNSFSPHLDDVPLLVFQTYGSINWTIYDNKVTSLYPRDYINDNFNLLNLSNPITYQLNPGDFLYVPRRMFHLIEVLEPRLTMSINCFNKKLTNSFDRKYYEVKN